LASEQKLARRRTVAALEIEVLGKAPKKLPLADSLVGEQRFDDRARHQGVIRPPPRRSWQTALGDQLAYLVRGAEETLAECVTNGEAFQNDERCTVSLGAREHRSHRS
jgi:hypothetical protein